MANTHQKRILIVEDDESAAIVVKTRLESEGFEAHAVASGAVALAYAAERRPDLVILDVKLPDIGGYQVARELRKIYHPWAVPILMLTGMDKPIDELRGFAHGADAYITKPYDSTELLKTIAMLLGETALT